jgi:hypothetical protein
MIAGTERTHDLLPDRRLLGHVVPVPLAAGACAVLPILWLVSCHRPWFSRRCGSSGRCPTCAHDAGARPRGATAPGPRADGSASAAANGRIVHFLRGGQLRPRRGQSDGARGADAHGGERTT